MNLEELRRRLAALIAEARQIVNNPGGESRSLTEEQEARYTAIMGEDGQGGEVAELRAQIARLEALEAEEQRLNQSAGRRAGGIPIPNINERTSLGDSEEQALAHFFRSGDAGGFDSDMRGIDAGGAFVEVRWTRDMEQRVRNGIMERRAVTDSVMNITTGDDGGDLVPTGFVPQIVRRKNERMLANILGVRRIPGQGTTVEFPIESKDPEPFATTAEQDDSHTKNYERDAAQFDKVQFTLVKKTKKLELTEELLDDEDASLLEFIADHIGRGMANTHNGMLLTEVAANGSVLKTFAAAAAIADKELENVVFSDVLSYYLDDGSMPAWVMRPTTYSAIATISGDPRIYAETPVGSRTRRSILGYPVLWSNHATAVQASAKSVYFGDWNYVGFREAPALRFIRDPYTVDGLVILKYSFRAVYGVLQAGAIGYGQHPTG